MFRSFLIAGLAGMSLCLAAAQAEPVTEEHFKIVTTGDLATLCAAEPGETLGTAALNFCHGFAVGVYQVLAEQQTAPRSRKMFCLPNPQPTATRPSPRSCNGPGPSRNGLPWRRRTGLPSSCPINTPVPRNVKPGPGSTDMKTTLAVCVSMLLLAGCADLSPTQQRALTGTAAGAAGGAAIGAIAGNAGLGAAIGAGAGLAGGLLVDQVRRSQQSAYQQGYAAGRNSSQ